ncbi:MAG: formate dehydrogenase accessory sulfurtransferase FdhD [Chitinophagaceae bacterium]
MEIKDIKPDSVKTVQVTRVDGFTQSGFSDMLSIEEPLEIRISYVSGGNRVQKNISVTMRTPGNDFELATGFLFTEGIISSYGNVKDVYHTGIECSSQKRNTVQVDLQDDFVPHLMQSDRNFYTTSSCGVCGKSSIQSIKTVSTFSNLEKPRLVLTADILYHLPARLRSTQSGFATTGGMHACGLFNLNGDLTYIREDVGRHNALDKLIGCALANDTLPLDRHILLLSGRASFELVQKAAMAGIPIVAAIGAPSSLAVELAQEFGITLLGFLRENRVNIYNSSDRILIPTSNEN